MADRLPEDVALVSGDITLTYAELDNRSNQLARRLRQLGARPGRFVALYFDRSELPIIAILACHKAGAAYVPIDPSYPRERVRHINAELDLVLCLTETALASKAIDLFDDTKPFVVDDEWLSVEAHSPRRLSRSESGVDPENLAYVIYTSGTTGRPKGVMTEHRHVTGFVESFNEICATGRGDRVYQGFSLSFDGSVEEIWMAFSNGSTLVVPTRDAPRFGDELGRYLSELGVTYFSTVPTLLATVAADVPSLRTVVLSGEACPPELVHRWARPGLRILNVYGPTEATVNTTVAECEPGRPVTIGRPLRGYDLAIVDDRLHPVPDGAEGELLISTATLARGYMCQPLLTAERFLPSAQGRPRCYRTGDLVRRNEDGELEFLGRIDGQVKIRGYRVELAEIEAVLVEHPSVRAASVRLVADELAAYVVTGTDLPDHNEIRALLESRVPPYMMPAYLDVLPELPRTTSGKVDRRRLPDPVTPLVRVSTCMIEPETELEKIVSRVWQDVLGVATISVDDDFFLDLGGHSLVAARMVTRLRDEVARPVAVRDAYQFPTVRRLAAHIESIGVPPEAEPSGPVAGASRWERSRTWGLQALSLYPLAAVVAIPLAVLFLLGYNWVLGTISTAEFLGFDVLLTVLTWPTLLVVSIAAKWLLIGRYRVGEHKLWGFYYWRWWLVERLVALSGAAAMNGTPLLPIYYRLMGAKVGARCTLDTVRCTAWDLVTIGHDTSIGADTQILGCRVENGMVKLGTVDIGSRCFIGIHSVLGLNVVMSDESTVDDQSLLADGQVVPAGEGRRGSPAQRSTVRLPDSIASQSLTRRIWFGLVHLVAVELMAIIAFLVPTLGFLALTWWLYATLGLVGAAIIQLGVLPVDVIALCLYVAALKRLILNGIEPGTHPVLSFVYVRKWLSDGLMSTTRALLMPVYTTLYLPPLLRLMGARIGSGAEISTVWSFAPELIDVAEGSFFADGSIIGGRRTHLGVFEVAVNRIGRRSFVGNSAILPVGKSLGNGCLLGVQSIPPEVGSSTPDGSEWLGSPPFALTNRIKVGDFDQTVTFHPTRRLYLQRGVVDGLRILIPYLFALCAAIAFSCGMLFTVQFAGVGTALAVAPVFGLASGVGLTLAVVALKQVVMGRIKPEIKPLWSMYVWLNELVNGAYESVAAPALLPLLGTPFLAPFLRLLGCRIGKHPYLATTLFSEFDLVRLGDRVALNQAVVIQNHLFEDRVFKSDALTVGDDVSIGNMSVVLYDSEIEAGAVVGPLSLVMKGERLRRDTHWQGIPTAARCSR